MPQLNSVVLEAMRTASGRRSTRSLSSTASRRWRKSVRKRTVGRPPAKGRAQAVCGETTASESVSANGFISAGTAFLRFGAKRKPAAKARSAS